MLGDCFLSGPHASPGKSTPQQRAALHSLHMPLLFSLPTDVRGAADENDVALDEL